MTWPDAYSAVAVAAYQAAVAILDFAKPNLVCPIIRSPIDGYLTNPRLRLGDYATAGSATVVFLNAASFWITGYF